MQRFLPNSLEIFLIGIIASIGYFLSIFILYVRDDCWNFQEFLSPQLEGVLGGKPFFGGVHFPLEGFVLFRDNLPFGSL